LNPKENAMADEDKSAPEQDPSEGSRRTIERELERMPQKDNRRGSSTKLDNPGDGQRGDEQLAIDTPVEPGDQNAQTLPPSF
jgi:hypothetical protein